MAIEIPHRFYMAIMAIGIFIFGTFIGVYVARDVVIVSFDAIQVGFAFTTIILLLIIGSLIVEIKTFVEPKKKGKK